MSPASFQLTPGNLPSYLLSAGLSDSKDKIAVQELPGGVSNIVLQAEWVDNPTRRWVVKQSLGRLRVREEWVSDRERIFREAASIPLLRPILGEGSLPQVIHVDRANYLYIMTAGPRDSIAWKDLLLAGQSDPLVAHSAGCLLSELIRNSRSVPLFHELFADRRVFEQLRVDPYYRQAAIRNPDVGNSIQELIRDSWRIQTALVHGDYSPKNMLVSGTTIFLIDFEVVHWGDPAFDAGFLISHLFLKAFRQPLLSRMYIEAVQAFWKALCFEMDIGEIPTLEAMTVRHLGGLMLARVDGKSPVEYIKDKRDRNRIRRAAKQILRDPPHTIAAVIRMMHDHLGEAPR
jgi:5-methylthioribose kinase